jgi:hypothetical protein
MDKIYGSLDIKKLRYEPHAKTKKVYNLAALIRRARHPVASRMALQARRAYAGIGRRVGRLARAKQWRKKANSN